MEGSSSKLILAALLFLLSVISSIASRSLKEATPAGNTEFIKTSCSSTTYPKLCFNSLSVHAITIQTSPRLLAGTALNVSLSSVRSTSFIMLQLSKSHGMSPREVSAMKDCMELLSNSVQELRDSMGEMSKLKESGQDFKLIINDIQTWTSAALTDETTCSDGFQGTLTEGSVRTAVRGRIVNVARLTSNALALVNRYSDIHG